MLFDHNVPKRFRREISGHEVSTTKEMGWSTLVNGLLLKAAAQGGFEAFISIDKKLEYEQNLKSLPLPVIVIDSGSNTLPAVLPFAPAILELLKSPLDRVLHVVERSGLVHRLTTPR